MAKICIDLDGVLANFHLEFIQRAFRSHGITIGSEPVDYDYLDDYRDIFVEEVMSGLFRTCPVYKANVDYVNELIETTEHEVYFITARTTDEAVKWTYDLRRKVCEDTHDWLREHIPSHPHTNLIFTDTKFEAVCKIGGDIMVEDNLRTAAKVVGCCHSFLVDRPWNRESAAKEADRRDSTLSMQRIHRVSEIGNTLIQLDKWEKRYEG